MGRGMSRAVRLRLRFENNGVCSLKVKAVACEAANLGSSPSIHPKAPCPSGKGGVCKTLVRRFESGRGLHSSRSARVSAPPVAAEGRFDSGVGTNVGVRQGDRNSNCPGARPGPANKARLAQWLAHLLDMQEVCGSSPQSGTNDS